MSCDAMLARSKDGVNSVETINGRASRARLAFVAGIGGIAEIVAPCALKQIAAGGSHVSQLRRSSGEKRFGKNCEILLDSFIVCQIAIANHSANFQSAIGCGFDLGERQGIDIHNFLWGLDIQFHQINQRSPTRDKFCFGLRAYCLKRGFYCVGLAELEGFHGVTSVTKSRNVLLRAASGALNRSNNVVVSTAAADISAHTLAHCSIVLAARFFQQRRGGHDLAGGAITALKTVMLQKSGLDGMQFTILGQAFDSGDLVPLMHDGKRQARIYAASVYVHRACAALSVVATLLCARKLKVFAQRIEKSHARL